MVLLYHTDSCLLQPSSQYHRYPCNFLGLRRGKGNLIKPSRLNEHMHKQRLLVRTDSLGMRSVSSNRHSHFTFKSPKALQKTLVSTLENRGRHWAQIY